MADSVLVDRRRLEATLDLIAALGPVEAAELPRAQDALGVLWQALVAKQEGRGSELLVASYRRARARVHGRFFGQALDLLAVELLTEGVAP